MTRWLPVAGFQGLYEVSDTGRVRSLPRKTLSRWGKFKTSPGKDIKCEVSNVGYARVCLSKHGKKFRYSAHRLVASAFIPNPNGKPCVNHKDSDRLNNTAANLEWCTHQENTLHAIATGQLTYSKDRRVSPEKLKTHCKWGHARTPDNVNPRGGCKICCREYARQQRANLREDK